MKNNKMMKASVASAMLLGLVAPTVLATTNVATVSAEQKDDSLPADINAKTGPDSIVIESANGIPLNDQKFNAYRLMDSHYVADGEEAYVIIPDWQKFFDKELGKSGDTHATNEEAAKYLLDMKKNPEKIKYFQEEVFDYARDNKIQPLGEAKPSQNTYTISNLPDGYYSVIQEVNDKTVSDSYNILVTVDGHDRTAKVHLKADVPSLLKTINGSGTDNQDKKAADYAIGDDVPFRLVSKVPDMSGFKADKNGQHGGRYVFEVCDTMSKGLTLNPQSVKIKIGQQDYNNFKVVETGTTEDGSHKWRIVFGTNENISKTPVSDNDPLSDADGVLDDPQFTKPGTPVVITYSAKLNSDAILGATGNANTANVLFSSNPYEKDKVNHTWDSKTHAFTFGLDLTKVNDKQEKLAGAEFEIKQNDKAIKVKKLDDGSYVVTKEDKDATTTVTSDKDGKIIVKGLDAGDYKLVETKAPAGYNLLKDPISFTIAPEYKQYQEGQYEDLVGELTGLTVKGQDSSSFKADKTTGMVKTTVVNKAGGLLPKTGGRGIFMLAAIGLALMALATYVLFGRKKATK